MDIGRLVYEMLDDCDEYCKEECKKMIESEREKCRKKIEALKAEIMRLKADKVYLLSKLSEKEEELKKCKEKLRKLIEVSEE